MLRLAPILLVVLVAAGCGRAEKEVAAPTTTSSFAGSEMAGTPAEAPDFALRDQGGRTVRLSSLRGSPVVVAFLYTQCPDVCPLIASNLNRALRESPDLRVLAVSVDPKNDTRAAVKRYVRQHQLVPRFLYLTGTRPQLEKIWNAYHVGVIPDAK